jgi:protein TonB
MNFNRTSLCISLVLCLAPAAAFAQDARPEKPQAAYSKKADGRTIPLLTIFGSAQGPKFQERVAPVYPFAAKKRGQEGSVLLRLSLDSFGILEKVDVVEATDPVFIDAAVTSVRKSYFIPAKNNHRPVASQAILPIHFRLKK